MLNFDTKYLTFIRRRKIQIQKMTDQHKLLREVSGNISVTNQDGDPDLKSTILILSVT